MDKLTEMARILDLIASYQKQQRELLEVEGQFDKRLYDRLEGMIDALTEQFDELKRASKERGRPRIGVTKKQSLTLTEETWNWIEKSVANEHASSRSAFIGEILEHARLGGMSS